MFVATPAIYPQACVICASAKGPLVDTFATGANGRVYVCALCVKRCARVLGLIKGPRMEQLLNHGELLDEAAKALGERDAVIAQQMTDLAAAHRKAEALEELLQQERDNAATRRHLAEMISESSKQLLQAGAA